MHPEIKDSYFAFTPPGFLEVFFFASVVFFATGAGFDWTRPLKLIAHSCFFNFLATLARFLGGKRLMLLLELL